MMKPKIYNLWNPLFPYGSWIPAFAGMTQGKSAFFAFADAGNTAEMDYSKAADTK
jgi:hypothetical protein